MVFPCPPVKKLCIPALFGLILFVVEPPAWAQTRPVSQENSGPQDLDISVALKACFAKAKTVGIVVDAGGLPTGTDVHGFDRSIRQALTVMDYRPPSPGETGDATISLSLAGQALGGSYTDGKYHYTGAHVEGKLVIACGSASVAYSSASNVIPRIQTGESVSLAPSDAPFYEAVSGITGTLSENGPICALLSRVAPLERSIRLTTFGCDRSFRDPECKVAMNLAQSANAEDVEFIVRTAKFGSRKPVEGGGWAEGEWLPLLRAGATRVLGQIHTDRARQALMELSQDPVDEVRLEAVTALGWNGDEASSTRLEKRLADKDETVRERAAWALGNTKSRTQVEALIAVASHDNSQAVQEAAAEALGEIGDSRAVAPLISILSTALYTDAAALALGKLGDQRAVEPLCQTLQNDTERIAALRRLPDAKDKEVRGMGPSAERLGAARALGVLRGERAVGMLLSLLALPDASGVLDGTHSSYGIEAARALGSIGDRRAVEPLLKSLKNAQDSYAEEAIIEAVGKIGDPGGCNAIHAYITNLEEKDRQPGLLQLAGPCGVAGNP